MYSFLLYGFWLSNDHQGHLISPHHLLTKLNDILSIKEAAYHQNYSINRLERDLVHADYKIKEDSLPRTFIRARAFNGSISLEVSLVLTLLVSHFALNKTHTHRFSNQTSLGYAIGTPNNTMRCFVIPVTISFRALSKRSL